MDMDMDTCLFSFFFVSLFARTPLISYLALAGVLPLLWGGYMVFMDREGIVPLVPFLNK